MRNNKLLRPRRPRTVKGTLLLLLLPSAVALMGIAWFVHGLLLDRMSHDFAESRLKDEVAFLAHQVRESGGNIDTLQTGDYFQEVFHHAFALHSGSKTVISPAAWRSLLMPLIESGADGAHRISKPSQDGAPSDIIAYRQSFMVNQQPVVVIVSENLGALKQGQSELHIWTAIVSLLLIVLLVLVIWFGINWSMRPVSALQSSLKKLQEGEIERIRVTTPEEFSPLVRQLNQLLDSLDHRLERSRDALANLSHSVKTPIAAVRQVLEDSSRELNHDLRQQMVNRLSDIDRQLEAEMRRSRFAGPQVGKSALPVKQARDLLWVLGRLYTDKTFELATALTEEARWPIEEHDLNEIIGNLLDNAGKWSTRLVELELKHQGSALCITVNDDGPGVPEQEIDALGQRGLRLDQQTPGHGLGLAIVKDIVSRYGGRGTFNTSPYGGLSARVEFSV